MGAAAAQYSMGLGMLEIFFSFYSVHVFLFKLGSICVSVPLLSKEQFHVHKENNVLGLKRRRQFSIIKASRELVFTKHTEMKHSY